MIPSKKQAEISSLWKIRLCFDCVKATNSIPDSFVAGQKLISWKDPSVNRCDIQSLVSFYSNINRTVGGYNVHFIEKLRGCELLLGIGYFVQKWCIIFI